MRILIISAIIAVAIFSINHVYAEEVRVSIVENSSSANCTNDFTSNKCYDPGILTINKGTTVTWVNDDTTSHTVTSGISYALGSLEEYKGKQLGPDGKFDSGIMALQATFSYTFNEVGEYLYFCILHPLMVGKVIVEDKPTESFIMDTSVELPYNREVNDKITLTFVPQAQDFVGKALDYHIEITKDGTTIWSETLHDNDGTLELMIMPGEGSPTISGGEESEDKKSTAMYMLSGAVFNINGEYVVKAEIVGINNERLNEPAAVKTFNVGVVPEFPIAAVLPMIIGLAAVLIMMRSKINPYFS